MQVSTLQGNWPKPHPPDQGPGVHVAKVPEASVAQTATLSKFSVFLSLDMSGSLPEEGLEEGPPGCKLRKGWPRKLMKDGGLRSA